MHLNVKINTKKDKYEKHSEQYLNITYNCETINLRFLSSNCETNIKKIVKESAINYMSSYKAKRRWEDTYLKVKPVSNGNKFDNRTKKKKVNKSLCKIFKIFY